MESGGSSSNSFRRLDEIRAELDDQILRQEQDLRYLHTQFHCAPPSGASNALDSSKRLLEEKLHIARSRRNDVSPISVLPTEILCAIFLECSTPDAASRVCQRWRDLALAFPDLWTDIRPMPFARLRAFLQRSQNAPLDIVIPDAGILNNLMAQIVLPHAHRARLLSAAFDLAYVEKVELCLQRPAPYLVSLALATDRHGGADRLMVCPKSFDGSTPRLRHVRLMTCYTDWSSPIFSNLVTLSFSHIPSGVQVAIPEMLCIFRRCPSLREVELLYALQELDVGVPAFELDGQARPPLPCLQSLGVSTSGLTCSTLLKCVCFSAAASVAIECCEPSYDSYISSLWLQLGDVYRRDQSHSPVFLALDIKFRSTAIVSLFTTSHNLDSDNLWSGSPPHGGQFVKVNSIYESLTFPGELVSVISILGLGHLRSLFISSSAPGAYTLTDEQWRVVDRSCPHLMCIGAGDFAVVPVVSLLSGDACLPGEQLPFQRLRELAIEGASFFIEDRLLERLLECLALRPRHPIETLHLSSCYDLSSEEAERLSKAVDHFIYDGGLVDSSEEEPCTGEDDWGCPDCGL